jgi:hypothetical protein
LDGDGTVNLSPKGLSGSFAVLDELTVAYTRRRELKFDPAWPASHHSVTAWDRVQALPDPG